VGVQGKPSIISRKGTTLGSLKPNIGNAICMRKKHEKEWWVVAAKGVFLG